MARHGENIRKRKDGRWEARFICGYKPDGRAEYRSVYAKTYQQAKEKRNLALAAPSSGKSGDTGVKKLLLETVMDEWLRDRRDSVKESTYARYTSLIQRHILPQLGGYPLSTLNTEVINSFLKNKLNSGRLDGTGGLSPKTVADIRSVLLLGLDYARQRGYPCQISTKIFYPRLGQSRPAVLTRDEQARLEAVLFRQTGPLELGILITLYAGLRIGEICALQWGDFHFDNGTVHISKTVLRIQDVTGGTHKKTKLVIDRPKTDSSNRTIPLPSFLLEILKQHRAGPLDYVLTGSGTYLEPRVCLLRYKRVLERAGLGLLRFTPFATPLPPAVWRADSIQNPSARFWDTPM